VVAEAPAPVGVGVDGTAAVAELDWDGAAGVEGAFEEDAAAAGAALGYKFVKIEIPSVITVSLPLSPCKQ
jgi:hypothetical protein